MTSKLQSPEQRERIEKAERLFADNVSFAYWVLNRYFPKIAQDEDIVQDALIGLWEACLAFDENKGFRFSAFATPCICNNIRMTLRKRKIVATISLDEPIPDNEDLTFGELIEDPLACIDLEAIALCQFIERLSEMEKGIVRLQLKGVSQREGGKAVGVSQGQYSRILKRIKKRWISQEVLS